VSRWFAQAYGTGGDPQLTGYGTLCLSVQQQAQQLPLRAAALPVPMDLEQLLARIDANERLVESVSDTLSDTLGAPSPIPRTEDGGVRVVSAHREPPSAAEQQALRGSVAVAEAEHDQDKQSFRTVRMCLMCGLPYSTPAYPSLARSLASHSSLDDVRTVCGV
jgi:hypothetical protein